MSAPAFLSRRLLHLTTASSRSSVGTTAAAARRTFLAPTGTAPSSSNFPSDGKALIVPAVSTTTSRAIASSTKNTMAAAAGGGSSSMTGNEIMASLLEGSDSGSRFVGTDVSGAVESLAKADAVCFDVDSTVIDEEGIDVLAASLGKGAEVAAWTLKAMEGDTKFEEALAARLAIIRPSKSDITNCLDATPLRLSPGVDTLIAALHERGTHVYLISGGFRLMIEPIAHQLNVSPTNIVANTILFDSDNGDAYAGFDATEPTSADMGKPKAVKQIKAEHGYETVVMVGDGATDMQAKEVEGAADSFIGYGGVAVRDAVRDGACWFVTDFDDMIDIVNKFGR